jgi:hypothetical protein
MRKLTVMTGAVSENMMRGIFSERKSARCADKETPSAISRGSLEKTAIVDQSRLRDENA